MAIGLVVNGCAAKMEVFPQVATPPDPIEVLLHAEIEYDGNIEYLPRTITETHAQLRDLVVRYSYDEKQVRSEIWVIPDNVRRADHKGSKVTGHLEILNGQCVIRNYTSVAVLHGSANFTSESLSEMRRRGLLAVRDNIEAQMYADKEFLTNPKPISCLRRLR